MTLQKKLQINIVMTNYYQRSGNYSSTYDYIFLDNLASSSYANLFRSDLKNLKIKTLNGSECQALYIPSYGTQGAAILARVPVSQISQTTKLLLDVHDTGTTFSSTLTTGSEVLMFDANSDTYSQFFMNYSGLSSNNDSTDGGKYLRARFVPSIDGSSPTGLYTTFASGQPLANNRGVVANENISGYSSLPDDIEVTDENSEINDVEINDDESFDEFSTSDDIDFYKYDETENGDITVNSSENYDFYDDTLNEIEDSDEYLNEEEIKNTTGIVMSDNNYSCGSASLATVLNTFGLNLTLKEVSQFTDTNEENGTSMLSLIETAKHYGFEAFCY